MQGIATFSNALLECQGNGGTLASILSGDQNEQVASLIVDAQPTWIGARFVESDGTWRWVNGIMNDTEVYGGTFHPTAPASSDYSNWRPGEPESQVCVAITRDRKQWETAPCDHQLSYVCQGIAAPPPLPPTAPPPLFGTEQAPAADGTSVATVASLSGTLGFLAVLAAIGGYLRQRKRRKRRHALLAERKREETAAAEEKSRAEASERSAAPARAEATAEDERDECSFWFVRADFLRAFEGTTPPSFQEIREQHPEALERQTVPALAAFRGEYARSHCVVSHRWMSAGAPDDATGAQFRAVQQHLRARPSIAWVWYDFW